MRVAGISFGMAAALALAGCTLAPDKGPLAFVGTAGVECVGAPSGGDVLIGDVIKLPGRATFRTGQVSLLDARGMKVKDSWVLPIVHKDAIGSSAFPATTEDWAHRVPTQRKVISDAKAWNLVVEVQRSGPGNGSASSMSLSYSSHGSNYVATNRTAYRLKTSCL